MLNSYKISEYSKKSMIGGDYCLILAVELIEKYDFVNRGVVVRDTDQAGRLESLEARRSEGFQASRAPSFRAYFFVIKI